MLLFLSKMGELWTWFHYRCFSFRHKSLILLVTEALRNFKWWRFEYPINLPWRKKKNRNGKMFLSQFLKHEWKMLWRENNTTILGPTPSTRVSNHFIHILFLFQDLHVCWHFKSSHNRYIHITYRIWQF